MSRERTVRNINQRIEMYNLFMRVAHKIRQQNKEK